MSGDPADVGGAPINVTRMVVKHVFESGGGVHQITSSGVKYSFGFSRRAAEKEDGKNKH